MKSSLIVTIILAAILMGIVIVGLAIGLILTGKSRLRRGCGLTPGKKNEDTTCGVCGNKRACKEDESRDRKSN